MIYLLGIFSFICSGLITALCAMFQPKTKDEIAKDDAEQIEWIRKHC